MSTTAGRVLNIQMTFQVMKLTVICFRRSYWHRDELNELDNLSRELVIFQKFLKTVFPRGLIYKWDVQYQLAKSWRK